MNINIGYRGMIQPSTTVQTQSVSPSAFMNLNRMSALPQPILQMNRTQMSLREATNPTANVDIATPKKMTWGEPTWLLLHTMAQKAHDGTFPQIRAELLNIIYSICVNLPCPDCSEHAKMYLDKIDFKNSVRTKTDLKNVMFSFHNEVNKRKGLPIYQYGDLDSKYSCAITINIIYNFMYSFEKKSKNVRMIANDNHRARIADMIKSWFNQNIKYFDP